MSDFFCAAPWRGLHINPRGDVKTCCAGDPNMLGNLNTQNIEEILQGPVMQEIRQSLRQHQPHAQYCYNCVQSERYGRSERDWHNSINADFDVNQVDDLYHQPTLVDVRWNTTCSLSCNYCGEQCSSRWSALKRMSAKSGTRPYYQQVCDYLEQHQQHLREVALVGGEPLLLTENEYLLDVIPEACTVTLITNASVDFGTNQIVRKLLDRSRVGWSMSFDNVGARFEYVRHGATWSQLEKNIDIVRKHFDKGHWGGIHAVYNIYNTTRLAEFVEWAKGLGLSTHWQSLYQPECLDPLKHSQAVRSLAQDQIQQVLSRSDLNTSEQEFFVQALENFKQPVMQDLSNQLRQHIHDMETLYHPDQLGKFAQLWPELSNLL